MTHYVEVNSLGQVLEQGFTNMAFDNLKNLQPNKLFIEVSSQLDKTQLHRWTGEEFIVMDTQPSDVHVFNYKTLEWERDDLTAWLSVKTKRDGLLSETDWVSLRGQETGQGVSPEWLAYRQALRDITNQNDPENIQWPVPPTA